MHLSIFKPFPYILSLLSLFCVLITIAGCDSLPGLSAEVLKTAEKLVSKSESQPQDPCTVCRNLVRSFERVSKSHENMPYMKY